MTIEPLSQALQCSDSADKYAVVRACSPISFYPKVQARLALYLVTFNRSCETILSLQALLGQGNDQRLLAVQEATTALY